MVLKCFFRKLSTFLISYQVNILNLPQTNFGRFGPSNRYRKKPVDKPKSKPNGRPNYNNLGPNHP